MNDENKVLIETITEQWERDLAYVAKMKINPRQAIIQEFHSFWDFSDSTGNYVDKS
ncbi:hypothetical protein [Parasphingorhabdus cellanae]|uniref:Uncharacterized protein n=1 Tax=Parasphingorhabdus cellanae TaxID=2806553 RepID=A0ABX7TAF4_9SPHN|nr:hypothetical protein [Parasphingorhabdus cellanae]QTD57193.1 hypothetical protein J4G78_06515 [Parasphingorhabdus cellanae]